MSTKTLKVAVLVVSDTASKDPSTDRASDVLRDVFRDEGKTQWEVADFQIVPDSVLQIQKAVTTWTDGSDPMNLVITTGGTGFAVKDITPEAINPLLHKHAPGLVYEIHNILMSIKKLSDLPSRHGMLEASLAVTRFAIMSRPVAGVRNESLIITLPGSPKGAKENLQAILKLLPHACVQASGADSRNLHAGGIKKLEQEAGLTTGVATEPALSAAAISSQDHHHHHQSHEHSHGKGGHQVPIPHTDPRSHPRSNDLSGGPTRRHRSSPYPMLSMEHALKLITDNVPPPIPILAAVNQQIVGCVLAKDVQAIESVPAFRASIVDGYAIIASEDSPSPKGTFPVAIVSHAQAGSVPTLHAGQIARITTGAPLPPGSTAVVMVEDTVLVNKTADGNEEAEVEILTDAIKPGENVREIGSDVRAGDRILRAGEGITAHGGELGMLASVGVSEVCVYRKPVVGVLSTGDEIVPHDRPGALQLGEVRDTNRPTLLTSIKSAGFEAVDLGVAADTPGALEETLRSAFQSVDMIVTSGGVSMGELDLLKPTIEHSLGGTIHFGRVSMKPGKPTTFATVPNIKDSTTGSRVQADKVIFSLPGNPASAVVTFYLFVLPALHRMSGISPAGLPKVMVTLQSEVKCDPARAEYHRVIVVSKEDGTLFATSTGGQRSSRIGSFKGANALLCLPAGDKKFGPGDRLQALLMGNVIGGW